MKVNIKFLIAVLMAAIGLTAAAAPKVTAYIVMKSGTKYEAVTFQKLPEFQDKELKLIINGEKVRLPSDSTDYIVLWHDEAPQRQALIKYTYWGDYDPKTNETKRWDKEQGWFSLEDAGDNMSYWIKIVKLKPSRKSMSMEVTSAPHFFWKKGAEYPIFIPQNTLRPGKVRDWLRAFLADDQVLINDITDKGYFNRKESKRQGNIYNPFLYEEMVKDYQPGRKE